MAELYKVQPEGQDHPDVYRGKEKLSLSQFKKTGENVDHLPEKSSPISTDSGGQDSSGPSKVYAETKSGSRVFGESPQDVVEQSTGKDLSSFSKYGEEGWSPYPKEELPDPIQDTLEAGEIKKDQDVDLTGPMDSKDKFIKSMTEQIDRERERLNKRLKERKSEIEKEKSKLQEEQDEMLEEKEELSQPFRQELQEKKREELYINKNFEERQNLVGELESLLQEGNDLIQSQREVTGLSDIRNPRIQKTKEEINARVGVIESVLKARSNQISEAQTMIDRTMSAIEADRQDQMDYYNTIIEMNREDILDLDNQERKMAEEQRNLIKGDLEMAEQTAQTVKEMMMDPANARMMGKAGVSLTDSPQEVHQKIAEAQYQEDVTELKDAMGQEGYLPISDPSQVPDHRLRVRTDSRGNKHYFKEPRDAEDSDTGGFSGTTMRMLYGDASWDTLTKTQRAEVEEELKSRGLLPYKSEPTDEFREVMEEVTGTEVGDKELKDMWDKYRERLFPQSDEPEKTEEGEIKAKEKFDEDELIEAAAGTDEYDWQEIGELSVSEASEYIYEEEEEGGGEGLTPDDLQP